MTKSLLVALLLTATIAASGQDQTKIMETAATFPGGFAKFQEYLRANTNYPKDAKKQKAKGVIFIVFSIKEDGYVDKDSVRALPHEFTKKQLSRGANTDELKELPQSCKDEAVRVIRNSPRWTPGTRNGVPIKQRMVIPMTFGK